MEHSGRTTQARGDRERGTHRPRKAGETPTSSMDRARSGPVQMAQAEVGARPTMSVVNDGPFMWL